MDRALEAWPARVAAAADLPRWGRHLTAEVLLEIGPRSWLLSLHEGRIATVKPGPFVMPRFTLALRIEAEGFARFLAPVPQPGWHDLLALRRQGALRIEGDTTLFFAHLLWFKGALALLGERLAPVAAPAAPYGAVSVEPITGRYLRMDIEGRPHRVYVEEAGEGTPLLLLHTAGSDGRQWRDLLNDPDVTRRFRCIAFDMPRHGKSSPPPGWESEEYRLTTVGYTGLVMRMIEALRLDRPIVMGCSIGGRIVLDLAAEHAGRCAASSACRAAPSPAATTTSRCCTTRISMAARSAAPWSPAWSAPACRRRRSGKPSGTTCRAAPASSAATCISTPRKATSAPSWRRSTRRNAPSPC
ncbi:alpha/beta fold hydrolase [Paeniroseomonas aquatica]|uniref:alpha/beta fold hydrolase n=1 Tax=Paeniroseomonas aquatica TaxID=373043 RepID=UPI00360C7F94